MNNNTSVMSAGGHVSFRTIATESIKEKTTRTTIDAGRNVMVNQKAPKINVEHQSVDKFAAENVYESRDGNSLRAHFHDSRTAALGDVRIEHTGRNVDQQWDGKPVPPTTKSAK